MQNLNVEKPFSNFTLGEKPFEKVNEFQKEKPDRVFSLS